MKTNKSRAEARPLHTLESKKPKAEHVWKQMDDLLVPRLRLRVADRAAYCYLLRHSRLEGKLRLHFSIPWLARGICLSDYGAACAVRRLIDHGALRLIERSTAGHAVDVRLPEEVLADHPEESAPRPVTLADLGVSLEDKDFLRNKALRYAIYAREGGRCFYCLRPLTPLQRCLDHVVPRARSGQNSYRNLVACCRECNAQKGQCRAEDFLRSIFRDRQLSAAELAARLRALDDLAAGKLRPPLPSV
jgi:hypothetical protein